MTLQSDEKKLTLKNNKKFSPEPLKVSKLGFLWVFLPNVKNVYMRLRFTGELCAMTMKSDGKVEMELTCQFKTDMKNLTNFHPSTRKFQKSAL